MRNSNLETLDEESGPLLPSRVTTSNPTRSPPSLTSPANRGSTQKLVKFVVINCTVGRTGIREAKQRSTGIKSTNGEVRVGASEGFKHPHDQRRLPHALRVSEAVAVRRLLGERKKVLRGFRGLPEGQWRGGTSTARRPWTGEASGGGRYRRSSEFCDSSDLPSFTWQETETYVYVTQVYVCAPWARFYISTWAWANVRSV